MADKIRFIDLFAGIGGFHIAFKSAGAKCVFSSEVDKFCRETYKANFGEEPAGDIKEINESEIPDHEILLAGFPCQSFSIAGVSKKNALGREHGFEDKETGNLFFDIAQILKEKRPEAFLLENVKNLKHHDGGNTFEVIRNTITELDYKMFSKVLDAQHYVPQHRERIFMAGFAREEYPRLELSDSLLGKKEEGRKFSFPEAPDNDPAIKNILQNNVPDKYTLSDKLWNYLQDYKEKHRKRGNGFGYGLIDPNEDKITRTLSSRYHKDGSEILIKQERKNPRRLTPRECARLMGFSDDFTIPVSDTQAYQQFGNSVVVPLVRDIAENMLKVMRDKQSHTKEKPSSVGKQQSLLNK